jgi:hypothetical protein
MNQKFFLATLISVGVVMGVVYYGLSIFLHPCYSMLITMWHHYKPRFEVVWHAQTPYREKRSGHQPMHEFSQTNAIAVLNFCGHIAAAVCRHEYVSP